MALWVLKGGRGGEREQRMLDNNVLALGWEELPDLSGFPDREALEAEYRKRYPAAKDNLVANHVGQLWAFSRTAQVGELVVCPLKTRAAIAVGEITGEYACRPDLGQDMKHTRPAHWLKNDVPRSRFDKDLLFSFGSMLTFCKVQRDHAEDRVRRIAKTQAASTPAPNPGPSGDDGVDIEQHSRDQILDFIGQKFRGHDLARLVEAILKAQGFVTRRSDPGPDGGVDILAGSGPMGFDAPRICVQVKSSDSPADVTVFRGLRGTMEAFHADQGLLVAWGGFKDTVVREAQTSFFRVRLWDAGDLLNTIVTNYDRLPDEVQAELPLKRIWALAAADGED